MRTEIRLGYKLVKLLLLLLLMLLLLLLYLFNVINVLALLGLFFGQNDASSDSACVCVSRVISVLTGAGP